MSVCGLFICGLSVCGLFCLYNVLLWTLCLCAVYCRLSICGHVNFDSWTHAHNRLKPKCCQCRCNNVAAVVLLAVMRHSDTASVGTDDIGPWRLLCRTRHISRLLTYQQSCWHYRLSLQSRHSQRRCCHLSSPADQRSTGTRSPTLFYAYPLTPTVAIWVQL